MAMGRLSWVILAALALAGWLSWTVIWWLAYTHAWHITLVWNIYHEQWVEGVMFHGFTAIAAWGLWRAIRGFRC